MNCEYNACRSRRISSGHSPDCPLLAEYNKSIKAEKVSTNAKSSDEVEPLTNESMDIDIKEEDNYDTTEAGCVKHHPKHALLHWTGCYIEDCKIHTNKRYEPKPPLVCTYCKRNGYLKEKSYKKLMVEYRMLNDIHKPSSTRAEVSTSSSERDDEETDK